MIKVSEESPPKTGSPCWDEFDDSKSRSPRGMGLDGLIKLGESEGFKPIRLETIEVIPSNRKDKTYLTPAMVLYNPDKPEGERYVVIFHRKGLINNKHIIFYHILINYVPKELPENIG